MKKSDLDLYTDYLLSTFGAATATGLSGMVDGDVSHDHITRFLSEEEYSGPLFQDNDLRWCPERKGARNEQSEAQDFQQCAEG